MKGIYLAADCAFHEGFDLIYQDINCKRDLGGDMLEVDLSPFDFIIATPPCNYYSRSNYRRDVSNYALKTKYCVEFYDKPVEIYGAIWTNKGLIYVAKMNDKGELELL